MKLTNIELLYLDRKSSSSLSIIQRNNKLRDLLDGIVQTTLKKVSEEAGKNGIKIPLTEEALSLNRILDSEIQGLRRKALTLRGYPDPLEMTSNHGRSS
jgi:hypothetical protein